MKDDLEETIYLAFSIIFFIAVFGFLYNKHEKGLAICQAHGHTADYCDNVLR
jgi:hypothetical protein